jgi:hypothetical protein
MSSLPLAATQDRLLTRVQIQLGLHRDRAIAVRRGGFYQSPKVRLAHRPATQTEICWAEHVSLLERISGSNQLPHVYPTVWRRRGFSTIIR